MVVGARGGANDAGVRIDHLQKLADNQRHRLNPLNLDQSIMVWSGVVVSVWHPVTACCCGGRGVDDAHGR